ncbi:hypothetical protein R3P38DRAFT_3231353 [Favolaschia claudopus]|uniref:Uncharacterized protein n=1 Tax=Favolaschia claudopus TaxID=2862362 RepID=A0AAV9ZKF0_9AGAR
MASDSFIQCYHDRGSGRPSTTRFGVQFHFDSSLQRALLLELCSVVVCLVSSCVSLKLCLGRVLAAAKRPVNSIDKTFKS